MIDKVEDFVAGESREDPVKDNAVADSLGRVLVSCRIDYTTDARSLDFQDNNLSRRLFPEDCIDVATIGEGARETDAEGEFASWLSFILDNFIVGEEALFSEGEEFPDCQNSFWKTFARFLICIPQLRVPA